MAETEKEGFLVHKLTDLNVGDKVLWDGRTEPLTVICEGGNSHILVEGPQGAVYRIQANTRSFHHRPFFLGKRRRQIENLRRVECSTDGQEGR